MSKNFCDQCGAKLENGTVFCPECGNETEVYSRITGYYRPIKNWNDGKRSEYKNRKVYDSKCAKEEKKKIKDQIMLFGTKTCPNCKMAEKLLDKAKVTFKFIDAEEQVDLTKKYGVKQAPTLVVISGGKAEVIANLSNIKKHIEEFKI